MSDSLTGLLFCCFCAGAYYWYHHRKAVMDHERLLRRLPDKVPDWAQAAPTVGTGFVGDPFAHCSSGVRRPYVVYQGELREVLHRKGVGKDVCCTLRPHSKGGARLKVTVPKDRLLWIDKPNRGD
jgi:hypothetical protein